MKNKIKREKYQHWKDIKRKADWYKPTPEQQPIFSDDEDKENNCVENNEEEIKQKGYKSLKKHFNLRKKLKPKLAETALMAKYLADDASKRVKGKLKSRGLTKALNILLATAGNANTALWEPGDKPATSKISSITTKARSNVNTSTTTSTKARSIDFSV